MRGRDRGKRRKELGQQRYGGGLGKLWGRLDCVRGLDKGCHSEKFQECAGHRTGQVYNDVTVAIETSTVPSAGASYQGTQGDSRKLRYNIDILFQGIGTQFTHMLDICVPLRFYLTED